MIKRIGLHIFLILVGLNVFGQLSPGELSEAHAHLEGMSNCTKCHELGEKVSDNKCLECHKELNVRIEQKKGFHSSATVYKKNCTICHSEHLGRQFDIVHLDKNKFDHQATGFSLEGKHKEKQCQDCHKAGNIKDDFIKKKKMTFLGLNSECLTCHADYHQKSLPSNCVVCHTFDAFKPAVKFNHGQSKFNLIGQHKNVDCKKCHEISTVNGKTYQKFKGLEFNSCANCHKDVHDNKFGQKCTDCHSEDSFKAVKKIGQFDHSKTKFKLQGKHVNVSCKSCHKGSLLSQIKYDNCTDCHSDFHKGQFKMTAKSDCSECHNEKGFQGSTYTIDRHNLGSFKLEGAHVATPCISCHKRGDEWQFRIQNTKCVSCHVNLHQGFIQKKYIPEEQCDKCHITKNWNIINFDHQITNFELKGKHIQQSCNSCHFVRKRDNQLEQKFSALTGQCEQCHHDVHQKQFIAEGSTNCSICHGFDNWKASKFNHNITRFKLEGAHLNVACSKCHFVNTLAAIPYVQYKNTDLRCISCHR